MTLLKATREGRGGSEKEESDRKKVVASTLALSCEGQSCNDSGGAYGVRGELGGVFLSVNTGTQFRALSS